MTQKTSELGDTGGMQQHPASQIPRRTTAAQFWKSLLEFNCNLAISKYSAQGRSLANFGMLLVAVKVQTLLPSNVSYYSWCFKVVEWRFAVQLKDVPFNLTKPNSPQLGPLPSNLKVVLGMDPQLTPDAIARPWCELRPTKITQPTAGCLESIGQKWTKNHQLHQLHPKGKPFPAWVRELLVAKVPLMNFCPAETHEKWIWIQQDSTNRN